MLRLFFSLLATGLLFMSIQSYSSEYWIDVRTLEEFNEGHIEGAHHIPFEEIAARIGEITDDKNATLHLYCRTGRRSSTALDSLTAEGFTNLINEGGFEDIQKRSAQ